MLGPLITILQYKFFLIGYDASLPSMAAFCPYKPISCQILNLLNYQANFGHFCKLISFQVQKNNLFWYEEFNTF
jgi:hypothetical protein